MKKKLKGFDVFVNESFAPIDVELYETAPNTTVTESDIDWSKAMEKDFGDIKDVLLKSINSLVWKQNTQQSVGASAGMAINKIITSYKIPKVDMVATEGEPRIDWIFASKADPTAAYTILGVQGNYSNGTYRIFFVDKGIELTPVGTQIIGVQESESVDLDEAATTPARKHPMYKKLLKFLEKFPNNTQSWSEATDEIRDIARGARESHTELDLDLLYDEWETNPEAPQPLDFRKLKSPSAWNTEGKKYIIEMLDKMGAEAANSFFDDYEDWLK